MPQVPIYDGPQVRTAPLQPVLQNAPDVSSGARAMAQGLGNLGEAADRIDLRDAQAQASAAEKDITSQWLAWDAKARNEYRGEKADGYLPAAQGWWKTAAETYGKDLTPRARALASQSLSNKQLSAIANVGQFVAGEKERHADDLYAADVTTTIQFGITTGNVAGTAQAIREKAAVLGARKGWTTEQVQAESLKNLSQMHLAQIAKLAEVDATAAQKYYDANKIEVAATAQPRVEEVIRNEGDNQFAKQFAASVADKPLDQQLAEASKITDPKRREKALTEVRSNYALVKEAQQANESRAADTAWQLFSQGKRVPEAVLATMDGQGRYQLQEAQRTRAERLAKGTPVNTDMKLYIDLRERLARGEKVDLRGFVEKIGSSDMEKLLDIQTASAKGGAKQDQMLTDEQRITNALVGLGIDKKRDPETAMRLTTEIDRQVRLASAAKGNKELTADEKQAVVDRVAMDRVYAPRFFGDKQTPVALLTPEEQQSAYVKVDGKNVAVSSVPALDRRQIITALKATGQPVTEQAIVEMYLAGQKKKGPAK